MTGLRQWIRDPEIPSRAGEPALRPLSEQEAGSVFREHLMRAEAPDLRSVVWEYARWKPGVSITCVYRLVFEDDSEELAVFKRYAGSKAQVLGDRPVEAAQPFETKGFLLERAVLPSESAVLWTPIADRELGLRYLLDLKRFSKLLRDSGLVEPGLVRRRRTAFQLLRYKPERRAVYRVDVRLRDEARSRFSMAARVLPPDEVMRIADYRAAFEAAGGADFAPRLACAHTRHGLLVEPWLKVEAREPNDFGAAGDAGELLARLHGLAAPAAHRESPFDPRSLEPLFGADPDLVRRLASFESLRVSEGAATTWVHADFHPDQLAHSAEGLILMDLDCLRPGDPTCDLASWIADHLFEDPTASWDGAADPILAGYAAAGGQVPVHGNLRTIVAHNLITRGAASVRRLERGALDRARGAFDRAQELTTNS